MGSVQEASSSSQAMVHDRSILCEKLAHDKAPFIVYYKTANLSSKVRKYIIGSWLL